MTLLVIISASQVLSMTVITYLVIVTQDANWAGLPMGSPNPIGFGPVLVMAL
jgi:hypothetical protein